MPYNVVDVTTGHILVTLNDKSKANNAAEALFIKNNPYKYNAAQIKRAEVDGVLKISRKFTIDGRRELSAYHMRLRKPWELEVRAAEFSFVGQLITTAFGETTEKVLKFHGEFSEALEKARTAFIESTPWKTMEGLQAEANYQEEEDAQLKVASIRAVSFDYDVKLTIAPRSQAAQVHQPAVHASEQPTTATAGKRSAPSGDFCGGDDGLVDRKRAAKDEAQ